MSSSTLIAYLMPWMVKQAGLSTLFAPTAVSLKNARFLEAMVSEIEDIAFFKLQLKEFTPKEVNESAGIDTRKKAMSSLLSYYDAQKVDPNLVANDVQVNESKQFSVCVIAETKDAKMLKLIEHYCYDNDLQCYPSNELAEKDVCLVLPVTNSIDANKLMTQISKDVNIKLNMKVVGDVDIEALINEQEDDNIKKY